MFLQKGSFELNFIWKYLNWKNDFKLVGNKLNMLNKPSFAQGTARDDILDRFQVKKETEETN